MSFLYGGLINAQQAAELSMDSRKKVQNWAVCYTEIEKMREISDVNATIQSRASEGEFALRYWIKFVDTYNKLVEEGYQVKGGVIRENLAPMQKAFWGEISDQYVISWGNDSSEDNV